MNLLNYGKFKQYIFLHVSLFIYSLSGILGKISSQYEFMSIKFIIFYILLLINLFIYAILWQKNLKNIPLTTAFANKSIIVIWGMIWGYILFNEKISLNMIVGSLVICIGIYMVVDNGK